MNLQFMQCGDEKERTIRQFVIMKNKWTSIFHACPFIDNEFRHNIVTLTML